MVVATNEITMFEAERKVLRRFLRYSANWSVAAKRNQPIQKSETSTLYFYVKNAAGTAWMQLTDANVLEIEWVDETTGEILIYFGISSEDEIEDNQDYELRVKFTDNSWLTLEKGKVSIKDSVVDTP